MNPLAILGSISPAMVARGLWHHLRTAARAASTRGPGLGWLQVFWSTLRAVKPAPPRVDALGDVTAVAIASPSCVELSTARGTLRVSALAGDLLRLTSGVERPSYSLAKPASDWAGAKLTVEETPADITLHTAALTVTISRRPLRLRVRTRQGHVLIDGCEVLASEGGAGYRARFERGTTLHGLGEKASSFDHTGRRLELWNTDPALYRRGADPIYLGVPFLFAQSVDHAIGLFFDNPFRSQVDAGASKPGQVEWLSHGGGFDLYLCAGTPPQVLERYTALTGRPRLPALWALGFQQSRYSYFPQARVLEVAGEFRRRRIPCDALHLDIHCMDGYRSFTWHPHRFPTPRAMLDQLHATGFKAVTLVDPGIKAEPGNRVFDEGLASGAFLAWPDGVLFRGPVWPGDCHFPDFSSPAVRAWWGGQNRGLLDDGVDGIWNDMNEPALISVPTGAHAPESLRHDADGRGATHAEVHNPYGALMARATCEGLERLRPRKRPVVLSRSGWAGIQRYALHWTGDNHSTWDDLRLSLPMVLNLGLSGVAFTGPDTGGFGGGPSPELFARWIQLSALLPFFRVHSIFGSPDQEPWAFGAEVEQIAKAAIELRYRLLPYLYTAAWQASQTGSPIARAMSFSFPDDARFSTTEDQFMCGDALLVAPVLEEGAKGRTVMLPAGPWFDFASGVCHAGGGQIEVAAPLSAVPVFVRGGSVLPLWPVQQYVGEQRIEVLTLSAWPVPGECASALYEDDGESPGGPFRISRFTLGEHRLRREVTGGTFVPTSTRIELIRPGGEPLRDVSAGGDFELEF